MRMLNRSHSLPHSLSSCFRTSHIANANENNVGYLWNCKTICAKFLGGGNGGTFRDVNCILDEYRKKLLFIAKFGGPNPSAVGYAGPDFFPVC